MERKLGAMDEVEVGERMLVALLRELNIEVEKAALKVLSQKGKWDEALKRRGSVEVTLQVLQRRQEQEAGYE